MTHKQIIIDGVDVSECAGYYFSPTGFHSCQDIQQVNNLGYEQDTLCEQNPNCHYKQLKRKEKSEEKLVKQIQTICDFINNRPETFKGINGSVDKIITDYAEAKEQECEKLKEERNEYFELMAIRTEVLVKIANKLDIDTAIIENKEIFNKIDQLKAENDQLKSLLKVRIEDLCDSCGAGSMMPMPCKVYEKTLTKIKKIMKKHCRKCQKDKFYHFKLCCTCKYTDILQKISEVEDDR